MHDTSEETVHVIYINKLERTNRAQNSYEGTQRLSIFARVGCKLLPKLEIAADF